MIYRILLSSIFLFTFLGLFQQKYFSHSVQLVHKETGRIILEFKTHQTMIYDHLLLETLINNGVSIPAVKRKEFKGKTHIYLNDQDFQKAFREIYCELHYRDQEVFWK